MTTATPAGASRAVIGAGQCVICGAPAAMGADVCDKCSDGGIETADTLVVVQGEERAYARVPASLAPKVVHRLSLEGKRARAVSVRYAMSALPARTWLLIVAVLVSGILASRVTVPAYAILTGVVALALLFTAEHAMIRPRREAITVELPARLQRTLDETFASLPAGTARSLLGDVVRRARVLLGSIDTPEESSMKRDVADLVDACCGISLEHARLGAMMAEARPSRSSAARPGGEVDTDQLRQRCEAAQETMAKRLRDASDAIGAMYVQSVERGNAPAERVAELTSELTAEASARRQASEEIEKLLQG
jgi:hypothetical protein